MTTKLSHIWTAIFTRKDRKQKEQGSGKVRKTCCHTKITERLLYAEMDISPVILIYVFWFLDLSDLAKAAGTCFVWWNVIKRYCLMENDWEELDLSGTGKQYCSIPRRAFRSLRYLNLALTHYNSYRLVFVNA